MIEKLIHEGVFVIHALKGYESHKERIEKLFYKYGMNPEFVTDGDPSYFDKINLSHYFSDNIFEFLSVGTISCTLNHILAYEKMIARDLEYALIFENDPFFLGNFVDQLEKLTDEIKLLPAGFIISLENSTLRFPSFWQVKRGRFLYRAQRGRMAGAYLIDRQGAQNILQDIKQKKCDKVIDWWHNNLVQRQIIRIYWAHPPLVGQGSHNGKLSATISSHAATFNRRLAWQVQKFYKYYFRRLFNEKNIIGDLH